MVIFQKEATARPQSVPTPESSGACLLPPERAEVQGSP